MAVSKPKSKRKRVPAGAALLQTDITEALLTAAHAELSAAGFSRFDDEDELLDSVDMLLPTETENF